MGPHVLPDKWLPKISVSFMARKKPPDKSPVKPSGGTSVTRLAKGSACRKTILWFEKHQMGGSKALETDLSDLRSSQFLWTIATVNQKITKTSGRSTNELLPLLAATAVQNVALQQRPVDPQGQLQNMFVHNRVALNNKVLWKKLDILAKSSAKVRKLHRP